MRKLFKSAHRITQGFGLRPEYYGQFGLKGHEGVDIIPTGSDWTVLALEDGVTVKDEDNRSSGAYGINVTLWHKGIKKATQYCHLENNSVALGQEVKKGDSIGKMGATGNTQGAHVHLNLFAVDEQGLRLNRNNGFFGGIDPETFLNEDTSIDPKEFERIKKLLKDNEESNKQKDEIIKGKDGELLVKQTEINELNSALTTEKNRNKSLLEAMAQDTVEDLDSHAKYVALEKEHAEMKSLFYSVARDALGCATESVSLGDIYECVLKKTTELSKLDEVAVKEHKRQIKLLEEMAFYKRVPKKAQGLLEKLLYWFR